MNLLSAEILFALNPNIQEVWVVIWTNSWNGSYDSARAGYLISKEKPVMPEEEVIRGGEEEDEDPWVSYHAVRLLEYTEERRY